MQKAGGARFDPRGYWQALSPGQQRAFGEAGLVVWLSVSAKFGPPGELPPAVLDRWHHAAVTLGARARPLIPDVSRFPGGPDLAPLGIRACRVCGCTDASGCTSGDRGDATWTESCSWVGDDLCSACPGGDGGGDGAEAPGGPPG